jgi:tetratricopeptide (TPR) repeat protein
MENVPYNRKQMKNILITIIITLSALTSFGQKMTLEEWNEQAKTNIRLLPKYGHIPKTQEQKGFDKEFIEASLKQYPDKKKASDHLVELGFKYLYHDVKTAMYRFNQAFLLDSTNSDIFWGYAGVYMTLGDYERAQQQYTDGLLIAPTNTHLLTDYGTYFMSQYYALQPLDKQKALSKLDSAISYMTKSYFLDEKDPNTTFKLSVCYYEKKDCKNAWKYYNECISLGGQPVTEDFTKALKEQCKQTK